MRKILGTLIIAAAAFFTGCTTDPATNVTNIYGDTTGIVSGDSVRYHEIRVDAFSHYWATQKLMSASLGSGVLVKLDTTWGEGVLVFDTLVLGNLAYDKTSSLPAHVVDSEENRIYYPASHEPKGFSCYYSNGGKDWIDVWGEETSPVLYSTRLTEVEGEEPLIEVNFSYGIASDPSYLEVFPCGYRAGKGFYLGYRQNDLFYYPNYAVPGGEIIIRY